MRQVLSDDPGAVAIVSSIQDAESSDFADDFELTLREAHWQTARIRNHTDGAGVQYGVAVGAFEGTTIEGTKRLCDALTAIGISPEEKTFGAKDEKTISPYFQPGILYLVIGHKRPTTLANSEK